MLGARVDGTAGGGTRVDGTGGASARPGRAGCAISTGTAHATDAASHIHAAITAGLVINTG
jgi:hypothetical protein